MLEKLSPTYAGEINEIIAGPSTLKPFYSAAELAKRENRTGSTIDDYEAAGIGTAADLTQLFQERFFFGCEADDPTAVWAYSGKTKLNPMFSSDGGHFNVIDMSGVLEEAFELVEDGDLDPAQFESFTFGNAARLHTSLNTDFFSGTIVDDAVQVLKN